MLIKLVYANVRGLISKTASIRELLSETDATVLCVTETHLIEKNGKEVDGYTFFGKARVDKAGGGVGIFVKNTMKKKEISK